VSSSEVAEFAEISLRDAIARAIGCDPDQIGLGDDLLDHGLDSIRLMSLIDRWAEQGAKVSFAELAAEPNVTAWAALLSARAAS